MYFTQGFADVCRIEFVNAVPGTEATKAHLTESFRQLVNEVRDITDTEEEFVNQIYYITACFISDKYANANLLRLKEETLGEIQDAFEKSEKENEAKINARKKK